MANERNALKAGIFIMATIALVVTGIILIAGPSMFAVKRTYQAKFPISVDLAGLRVGDDVRLGGSKLGAVTGIDIVTDAPEPHTLVTFAIPTRVRLKTDAQVSVSASFTGLAQLNIPVIGSGPDATEKDILIGRGGGLNAVLENFQRIGPKVEATISEVQSVVTDVRTNTMPKVNTTLAAYEKVGTRGVELIDHVRTKVDPAFDQYNKVTENAAQAAKNIGDLVGPGNGELRSSLTNVRELTEDLKEKVPVLVDRIAGLTEKVATTLDRASDMLEKFKDTGENARVTSATIRELVARNSGRIESIIVSSRASAENLRLATSEIRRSPWRLLYKPSKDEMLNQDLFNATREFAEGAAQLADVATTLQGLRDSGTATEAEINTVLQQLEESFKQFKNVEKRLYDEVR
jgi:ABC-type transporter Mla subunit MlaD